MFYTHVNWILEKIARTSEQNERSGLYWQNSCQYWIVIDFRLIRLENGLYFLDEIVIFDEIEENNLFSISRWKLKANKNKKQKTIIKNIKFGCFVATILEWNPKNMVYVFVSVSRFSCTQKQKSVRVLCDCVSCVRCVMCVCVAKIDLKSKYFL